jgi:hypothetical protein
VSKDGKWSYIDTSGKEVILCPHDYDIVCDFQERLALVKRKRK